MTRPSFSLEMEVGGSGKFVFTDANGIQQDLGSLSLTRQSLEFLLDLIGRGEEDAKAEFTIENIQEIFYADQERGEDMGGTIHPPHTKGGGLKP